MAEVKNATEIRLSGIGVSEGIRIGKALLYGRQAALPFDDIAASEIEQEVTKLTAARERCLQEVSQLYQQARQLVGDQQAGVIQAQESFLNDPGFCPEMEKLIRTKLFSAAKAADQVINRTAAIFANMPNEYMRERAADIKDIGGRLLAALAGGKATRLSELREKVVLIAEDLAPSDTLQLNKQYIQAFVTQKGGKTSHTAIFSKTIGIPAVIGVGDGIAAIADGDTVIVDGTGGFCIVQPSPATLRSYQAAISRENEENSVLQDFAGQPAVTVDGYRVEIGANIGTKADAQYALEQGAEGIGLLRTELIYMAADHWPDEEEQFAIYRDIIQAMDNKPVIIRTLDIGGDKELSYLQIPPEANPFLGYRAIRLCLDRQALFGVQLRAILRASAFGAARIMFPMISCLDEWRQARSLVAEMKDRLRAEGRAFAEDIPIGMMIEVPSAAILARQFAKEVDFFSIGTNDLVQYTLAVDRMNEKVDYLYDHFHPAIIALIEHVVQAAHAEGKFVGMCGGMAGDPKAAPLLLALGLDELSMSAAAIRKVKQAISRLELASCRKLLADVLQLSTAGEIRAAVEQYLTRQDIR